MTLSDESQEPEGEIFEWNLDRMVFLRNDGKWVNQRQNALQDTTEHDSQMEAIAAARRMLVRQNGGELIVFGEEGKVVRFSDVVDGED
ncbi:MAG: DUF2188 domain-containing protein [Gammaproteobacteria bacterium]|nr:DUF2188 domain-containing protein [Gammaproteobacteria bacterium]MBU1656418.1 DUF2188 domain-containing protein [Gammaproteobacteria bacterium]MBU1960041.1 DUF2188 domain-containing protein [Gammaproteobacteria bacterium]